MTQAEVITMNIADGPHYEIHSGALADWIDRQPADQYWQVDGDPLLGGKLSWPAPSDKASEVLRRVGKPLLLAAPEGRHDAKGQVIGADDVDALATRFRRKLSDIGEPPEWVEDREFYFCWKGDPREWRFVESSRTAKHMRELEWIEVED